MTTDPEMDCARVQDLLDDYRRGSLTDAEQSQVRSHLGQCEECTAELHFCNALAGHLQTSLPAGPAMEGLSPAVLAAVRPPHHKLANNDKKMVLLPWMFAAAAIIIFAVAFYNNLPQEKFGGGDTVAFNASRPSVSRNETLLKERQSEEQPAALPDLLLQQGETARAEPTRELIASDKALEMRIASPAANESGVAWSSPRNAPVAARKSESAPAHAAKDDLDFARPSSKVAGKSATAGANVSRYSPATTGALTSASISTTSTSMASTTTTLNTPKDGQRQ